MKKLILTTSALTLVAGAAVADIDFSAEASVSYGNWGTGGGAAAYSFGTSLELTAEETTSSGITYGASGSIDLTTGAIGDGVIWINTPNAGKFSFGVDAFEDSAEVDALDIEWDYANGAMTVNVLADAGLGVAAAEAWSIAVGYDAGAADLSFGYDANGVWSAGVAFEAGNMEIGLNTDSTGAWDASVGTELAGMGVTVTYDSANVAGVELTGDAGGVDWTLAADSTGAASVDLAGSAGSVDWTLGGDNTGAVNASVSTTMGATSMSLAYDSANAGGNGDDAQLILSVEHTIDMLTLGAMVNDANEYEISATAGFSF